MATNRDLLKEAIADAKAVKETAIANAKAALEEAFTPFLREKLSAKLAEMDESDVYEETEAEKENEVMMEDETMEMDEVSLDELLAELEEESDMENENYMDEESLYEAEGEEEEMSIEDMDEDDLKHFIEDVIKDMVSAGELEAGHEGMEDEEGEEEMEMGDEEELDEEINIDELLAELEEGHAYNKTVKDSTPKFKNAIFSKGKDEYRTPGSQEKETPYSEDEATKISFMDEEDLNESAMEWMNLFNQFVQDLKGSDQYVSTLTGAIAAAGVGLSTVMLALKDKTFRQELLSAVKEDVKKATEVIKNKLKGGKSSTPEKSEMEEQLDELRSELNEVNLLNAKLLYTNKIFRNKSLNETQKVKVLTAFDKATSKKEVELVYETLLESLKVSNTKAPIKESMSSASRVLGGTTSKPIIENDAFARMRELAFGNKK